MSSKRGRKRNDNLPPNRARDVQRAFRARRAAHLEALEQRVAELEEENNTLRAALNLPPANRPPLGRGPTGKDKPKASTSKSPPAVAGIAAILPSIPALTSSGTLPPMSRTESPLSTGSTSAHSMSPDPVLSNALPLPQPTAHDLDPTGWSDSMFGNKDSNPPLSSSTFTLPPSAASLGRSTTSDLFGGSVQDKFSGFPSSDEKSFGYLPSEERRTFTYPHSLLSGQPPSSLPPSLQAPNGANGGGDAVAAAVAGGAELPPSLPAFLQRRSITEPDSFRTLLNQMSHVQPAQNSLHTPIPRMSTSALLNAVDSHMSEYDLPGGAERRYPRLH
ncbi:hypothetical protein FKP32DRAFT_1681599 [Trametes sanguinea]|nr:hypothetical protein FKP32DRAFT_1681599 [Trametes sanguinea]